MMVVPVVAPGISFVAEDYLWSVFAFAGPTLKLAGNCLALAGPSG